MPMSRRKQLNPKPAKRETPDLGEQQVANLPSSHLYLREFGGESLVLAKHKLRAGTVLGTYSAPPATSSHEGSLLTINRSDGGPPVHVMLDNEGHWLKLMRTANLPTEANICLRISGEELVCTVTKDVNKEVELKVTCHIVDKENAQEFEHSELSTESHLPSPSERYCHSDSNDDELNDRQISKQRILTTPEEMLFFASRRVENFDEDMHSRSVNQSDSESIEMEKSRNDAADSDCENNEVQEEGGSSRYRVSPSIDGKIQERKSSLDKREMHSSDGCKVNDNSEHLEQSEMMSKLQGHREEERFHKCQRCNFTTKDQHSLEKHMQSHRNPPSKRPSSKMTNAKSYCDNCKIQFMSIDTYHVHKQLYCKSRHEKDEAPTSPSLQEPAPIHPPVGFKPGPDTVIIRGGVSGGVANSLIQPQALYAAISTNPLILLPCSLVNGQSLVPQGSVMPTGAPGIVLQTGIACPTIVEKPSTASKLKDESLPSRKTSHPIMHFSENSVGRPLNNSVSLLRKRKMSEGDVLNLKKVCANAPVHSSELEASERESQSTKSVSQDIPLDLSFKKFPDVSRRSPVKRKESVSSPGCHSPTNQTNNDYESPQRSSVVHSRVTSSPSNSYSNDSVHCYPTQIPIVLTRQSSIDSSSSLPPVIHVDNSLDKHLPHPIMPPPKIVKQGNNVCEECNIVFYKYDNYLAHKRHYCAYRRQQLSALAAATASNQEQSSDDNNSNHSGIHESESSQPYQPDENSKSGSREPSVEHFRSVIIKSSSSVYCCDACGVKFSTPDNLEAHQTYYCIKKADSVMSKKAGNRGENSVSPKGLESPFDGPEEWKCNYCDATCSSYDTISRHLSTHTELKGYRCIVCGYKGNTMRGMRNHACEHLTEGSISIEEFILTKVISESSSIVPIATHAPNSSDDESENLKEVNNTFRRDQTSSERARTSSKKNVYSSDHSESNEVSNSPRTVEKPSRDHMPTSNSPIKMESSSASSADANCSSPHDRLNPSAFCDVVIKTENDQSSGEDSSSKDGESKSFIKYEPDPEYDSEDHPQDLSMSPPGQSTSVIRRASDMEGYRSQMPSAKRKSKSLVKHNTELKYCKVCDISFSHLSNFIAHKKFYCVSRVIHNCIQEVATVQ